MISNNVENCLSSQRHLMRMHGPSSLGQNLHGFLQSGHLVLPLRCPGLKGHSRVDTRWLQLVQFLDRGVEKLLGCLQVLHALLQRDLVCSNSLVFSFSSVSFPATVDL